ncbi:hypothetical protein AlacWU_05927 [Aspergillus niger]|nr:hypothetical protein AlacWU_05927 [Aspergillus niger]
MWHLLTYSRGHADDESQEPLCKMDQASEFSKQINRDLRRRLTAQYFLLMFKVAVVLLASITLLIIGYWFFKSKHEAVYSCGTTPEEAVERDCQFDMLSFAWVPKPCFDAELSSAYNAYEDFEFFYHRERPDRIPVEELRRGINKHLPGAIYNGILALPENTE